MNEEKQSIIAGGPMAPDENTPIDVVDVQFRAGAKVYYFDPGEFTVSAGDHVIIETARGPEYGICAAGNHQVPFRDIVPPLRKVLRMATEADKRTLTANRAKEKRAFEICQQKIQEHGLDMQLVSTEYAFDGSKILFFFTADDRVDFRELVKNLASIFRTRIELRQIGVRDKAKMVGGLGICGRPFCCAQFLENFQPVSIKMAKTQNLSLNPTKISGTCGRLMCCLKYEQNAYEDAAKRMPKVESFVQTPDGPGNVKSVDLLRETMKVNLDSAGPNEPLKTYHGCEVCVLRNGKGSREGIAIPERPARYVEEKPEEEFLTPVITATPFYTAPELEDAPIREKMGQDGDGKPRRRHRGGRRRSGGLGIAAAPAKAPEGSKAPGEADKKPRQPRPPKQGEQKQPPRPQKAEGAAGGEEVKRRKPRHRGGRRRSGGKSGGENAE